MAPPRRGREVTAPSIPDFAVACVFLAGMACGWFVRWLYAERER